MCLRIKHELPNSGYIIETFFSTFFQIVNHRSVTSYTHLMAQTQCCTAIYIYIYILYFPLYYVPIRICAVYLHIILYDGLAARCFRTVDPTFLYVTYNTYLL